MHESSNKKKSPGTIMGEEIRKEANKMTEEQREEALAAAMRAIYAGVVKEQVQRANCG
jgi:hypothetical protein